MKNERNRLFEMATLMKKRLISTTKETRPLYGHFLTRIRK